MYIYFMYIYIYIYIYIYHIYLCIFISYMLYSSSSTKALSNNTVRGCLHEIFYCGHFE